MMNKLKPWLLMGGIFVIGVVTGGALSFGLGAHFMHGPMDNRDMNKHWMAHLTKELNLTADQQAKIQPILADADVRFHALFRDEKQQGAQIFRETDDKIAAVLTPDQEAELKKMEAEREKMFPGHRHSPGDKFDHGAPDGSMPTPPPPPPGPPPPLPPK
jgi:Spy/CpxP family protein refolding chaperone